MLSWRNATTPPSMMPRKAATISTRWRSAKTMMAFMAMLSAGAAAAALFSGFGCRRHPVDEQAAPGDHAVAWHQAIDHLDHVAVGQSDLDAPQLDRLVVVAHHPDPRGGAFIDDRLARHGGGGIALA